MNNLTFHVNYKNNVYTYNSGTEAMIFDYGVNNDLDRKYGKKALFFPPFCMYFEGGG